jgi:hypothetical protein
MLSSHGCEPLTKEIERFSKNAIEWLKKSKLMAKLNRYDLKYISNPSGDLGDLEGVQFNNESKGGYLYFWSNGFVTYHLFDHQKKEEVIEETLHETDNISELNDFLKNLMDNI